MRREGVLTDAEETMPTPINSALMRLTKRAETSQRQTLIDTFVDVGPLLTLLNNQDHQVIFGRRGTGKTHALTYLASEREKRGDAVATIDLRNVGSNTGMYGDPTRSMSDRATGLAVDVLQAIHETLIQFFVSHDEQINLGQAGPALDAFADSITQVKVVGEVDVSSKQDVTEAGSRSSAVEIAAAIPSVLAATIEGRRESSRSSTDSISVQRKGPERLYVNFGSVSSAIRALVGYLDGRRLWILLDEWSSLPMDLQPYLADLLRRSIFPITGVTVKIAAIEQRSQFTTGGGADYIGIELGADAAADVSLDDFMVFDNDQERAKAFFSSLVGRHAIASAQEAGIVQQLPSAPKEVTAQAFTEKRAFEEFVRASEGVPRDAINLLTLAAQRALDRQLSVHDIRVAAKDWYQRDKYTVVSHEHQAQQLLHWVIDEVIGERRARAFLLEIDTKDELIDKLYDARVLHVVKRGVSTNDQPGVRFNVYKLDYGCYVDLIGTARAPLGGLPIGAGDSDDYVDVPTDDYRSIRRAILSLEKFYEAIRVSPPVTP